MHFSSSSSINKNTPRAITEALSGLEIQSPNVLFFAGSHLYDFKIIKKEIEKKFPNTPFHAISSCQGCLSNHGIHKNDGYGMGIIAIEDSNSEFGIAMVDIGDDPIQTGKDVIIKAIANCNRHGESPNVIIITPAPGHEEKIIEGIQSIVGPTVPIFGGSLADNEIAGKWYLCTPEGISQNAVGITAIYSDNIIATAFHNGYQATETRGIVTKAKGRTILEINNRQAATVYNEWTNNSIGKFLEIGGSIQILSSLHPLGRVVGEVSEIPYYKLAHPEAITKDGGINLFADINEGDEIIVMKGTKEGIVARAQNVIQAALDTEDLTPSDIAGGLLTICAGCMFTIGDDIEQANKNILKTLDPETPYLAAFTFGEQGTFPHGENCHGNLMFSALLFAKSRDE